MKNSPYKYDLTLPDILEELEINEETFKELFKTPKPTESIGFQTQVCRDQATSNQMALRKHRTPFPKPYKTVSGKSLWTTEQLNSWRKLNF
jgi:hypothetical protein